LEGVLVGFLSRFVKRDRREYRRLPARFDVMYGRGEELTLTTSVDISEGGLSFLSKSPIPEGTELDMRLMIAPDNQEDMIELKSKVVRNEGKRTAVAFEDVRRSDLQRLLDFMARLPADARAAEA
jgi:c-di-GMP-binding flagellar brake protein YcgR